MSHRYVIVVVLLLALAGCGSDPLDFRDAEAQTRQFIEWEQTIKLTAAQEAIKKEALTALPAPCCSNNTAYTCCCPCNMSRATWGLTNYMIVEKNAGVKAIQAKVTEWAKFISPEGHSGDTCYTGGCARPFNKNGCGGMKPEQLTF